MRLVVSNKIAHPVDAMTSCTCIQFQTPYVYVYLSASLRGARSDILLMTKVKDSCV